MSTLFHLFQILDNEVNQMYAESKQKDVQACLSCLAHTQPCSFQVFRSLCSNVANGDVDKAQSGTIVDTNRENWRPKIENHSLLSSLNSNLRNKEEQQSLGEMTNNSNDSQSHSGPIAVRISNKGSSRIAIPYEQSKWRANEGSKNAKRQAMIPNGRLIKTHNLKL